MNRASDTFSGVQQCRKIKTDFHGVINQKKGKPCYEQKSEKGEER